MKRIFYFIMLLLLGQTTFTSCDGTKKDAEEGDSTRLNVVELDSIDVPQLTDDIFTIGDGTTMNTLELVSEKGDTINVECSDDAVMGGVNVGDKVAVTTMTTQAETKILTCINISALEHVWTQKGADGHKQSIEIDAGGIATTYNMNIEYDHWSLCGGKMLLSSPKEVASEQPSPCDTFDIMQLDDDKLVLSNGNLVSEFDRDN